MATIKPIEARSVHQIQSGQVIIDLCSVVKELVENSLDAGATSLEVCLKNNGLDSIQVQDNGSGIAPSNYESLALKHHTSKLASYDDLSTLHTFGFRGEALSSLCALSTFYVITALADEAPKGNRLDFESSGRLKSATVTAAQRGTTAVVEGLFESLPVRRKELTKNIKKEYGKVLGLLHAYACIGTHIKFTVKNSMAKGKNATVFATRGNPTTKENIANVYGAKTLSALVPLELQLEFQRSLSHRKDIDSTENKMLVQGHISRPVFGEGRQTPDRQMFFVNGRPCGLPQIAKAFNEVYKSFNFSQSPFIFADLKMDTNAYDVNVSPDKRTIMLHNSVALVETIKTSLTELFDQQEQTMPQSQVQPSRLPAYKQLTIARESTVDSTETKRSDGASKTVQRRSTGDEDDGRNSVLHDYFRNQSSTREEPKSVVPEAAMSKSKKRFAKNLEEEAYNARKFDEYDDIAHMQDIDEKSDAEHTEQAEDIRVRDFNMRMAEQQPKAVRPTIMPAENGADMSSSPSASSPTRTNFIQEAFDRVRPNRPTAEIATITVGDKTVTTVVGSQARSQHSTKTTPQVKDSKVKSAISASTQAFTQRLKGFAASGTADAQMSAEETSELEAVDEPQDLSPISTAPGEEQESPSAPQEDEVVSESNSDIESNGVGSIGSSKSDTDGEYIDETEKKAQEDATVAELIRAAEEKATSLNLVNPKRANRVLKSGTRKDSTASLQATLATSIEQIQDLATGWHRISNEFPHTGMLLEKGHVDSDTRNEEEHLALTVSKTDFSNMRIVGQFNLGFILAVRNSSDATVAKDDACDADELFIIDQHASDEKFNFERLQAETVVGNQRLVRPKQLDLTAVEEEILIENSSALEKNGFLISIDTSENEPIGQRCKLTSLPLSKEVTFGLEDLEELLHLLAESPGPSQSSSMVPRPSKVRKMFAMRACRSSIMIGKTLTEPKMRTVVAHMGEIDKPWNCPHGRPTMRHLMTLGSFETWREGDGMGLGLGQDGADQEIDVWNRYAQ
jgi:DNA mismatch repair protein PMS2